jgi:hypothetical protein
MVASAFVENCKESEMDLRVSKRIHLFVSMCVIVFT